MKGEKKTYREKEITINNTTMTLLSAALKGVFTKTFMLAVLLLSSYSITAQTSDYEKDLEKLLQINGSTAMYNIAFNQIKTALESQKPDVPDSLWVNLKTEVFDIEVTNLTKQMVPIYKKHFTQKDVKELITFYETPIGKKLTTKTPLITKDAMQISQPWAMSLMGKFNTWLTEKGY